MKKQHNKKNRRLNKGYMHKNKEGIQTYYSTFKDIVKRKKKEDDENKRRRRA